MAPFRGAYPTRSGGFQRKVDVRSRWRASGLVWMPSTSTSMTNDRIKSLSSNNVIPSSSDSSTW